METDDLAGDHADVALNTLRAIVEGNPNLFNDQGFTQEEVLEALEALRENGEAPVSPQETQPTAIQLASSVQTPEEKLEELQAENQQRKKAIAAAEDKQRRATALTVLPKQTAIQPVPSALLSPQESLTALHTEYLRGNFRLNELLNAGSKGEDVSASIAAIQEQQTQLRKQMGDILVRGDVDTQAAKWAAVAQLSSQEAEDVDNDAFILNTNAALIDAMESHFDEIFEWEAEPEDVASDSQQKITEVNSNDSGNADEKFESAKNEFRRIQEESAGLSDEDLRRYHKGYHQGSDGENIPEFGDEDRRRLGNVYGRLLAGRSNAGQNSWIDLSYTDKNGKTNHFNITQIESSQFHDIFEVNRRYLPNGELVDLHDNYDDCKCFLSDDGLCGFAVEPDGNLVSVFSLNPSDKRGFLYAIKDFVRQQGASHLDAYASSRQNLETIYKKTLGFHVVSEMAYNMEFDHDDIAANHGAPNIVFMVDHETERKTFDGDSYDEAKAWQKQNLNTTLYQDIRGKTVITEKKGRKAFQILLSDDADISTLAHEVAHIWFAQFEDFAKTDQASKRVKQDYQRILDFLEAKPGEAFTEDQQEKFARAFELFLMEGEAPSKEMERPFERFKKWLGGIYRKIEFSYDVELNDNIRPVFQRMFATDRQARAYAEEAAGRPISTASTEGVFLAIGGDRSGGGHRHRRPRHPASGLGRGRVRPLDARWRQARPLPG